MVVKKKVMRKAGTAPKGSLLSKVLTDFEKRPDMMLIHGVGGIGKTSFCYQWEKPLFMTDTVETGVQDLIGSGVLHGNDAGVLPPVESYNHMIATMKEVVSGGYADGYRTFVIDCIDGMEQMAFEHHCNEAFHGDWSQTGFYAYQQGPRNAARTLWPEFLNLCFKIRESGMNVLLVSHSRVTRFENPEGPDFNRWVPTVDTITWEKTFGAMECVVFMNYYIDVRSKDKDRDKMKKGKAVGDGQRMMYLNWHPLYDAKNRWGIRDPIDMGDDSQEAFVNFTKQRVRRSTKHG